MPEFLERRGGAFLLPSITEIDECRQLGEDIGKPGYFRIFGGELIRVVPFALLFTFEDKKMKVPVIIGHSRLFHMEYAGKNAQ